MSNSPAPQPSAAHRPQTTELHRMVQLSEEIKRVDALAREISLIGLNAILVATRAGDAALGFGVLSRELRRFTGELEQRMKTLGEQIDEAVAAVSDRARHERLRALLVRTAALDERCAELVQGATDRATRGATTRNQRVMQLGKTLRAAVTEARSVGLTGTTLARATKVEAAYGGAFREEMNVMSSEFDRSIQSIATSLAALDRLQREL